VVPSVNNRRFTARLQPGGSIFKVGNNDVDFARQRRSKPVVASYRRGQGPRPAWRGPAGHIWRGLIALLD